MKILIYGYGNPGRQDDGLGIKFTESMEEWANKNNRTDLSFENNYQLNIEDSFLISEKDLVIFADASIEELDSFIITQIEPSDAKVEFTMHAVSAAYIVDLCQKLYNKKPPAYLMHIKGYEFELQEGLTQSAQDNLGKALAFMQKKLSGPLENLCS